MNIIELKNSYEKKEIDKQTFIKEPPRLAVDIEGFHDPVFRGDREIEGQLLSLAHLRKCRDAASA